MFVFHLTVLCNFLAQVDQSCHLLSSMVQTSKTDHFFKGELNPEMKLCELLVLGHCIHLPLILFACASSGQSYNVGSPVPPNFCDVIDTAMTGDPIAF